ncbi:hypothetical protein IM700_015680 [Paenibacillus sp. DXFW5]|uniref:YceG-like family protein n=1 Tax=Paenibacillus rhizolycopersici TaxID=2780073 RepID=A0ABS2H8D5_9BACL|nr:hypothetical protein [Paenibacillus rhizolycopersici]MBM6997098.1 hypothetical protein [Paenibacillus rhizolycopersici]
MMKNRQFMLGLGCGLIAGALLLQLMLIGQGNNKELYTREQIERAAVLAGLKVVEVDQELLTEEEWQERSGQASDMSENGTGNSPVTPVDPTKPNSPTAPNTPNDPGASDGQALSGAKTGETSQPVDPESPQPATVEYKIVGGTTLEGVAQGLEQAGVIADKSAFLKTAVSKKINYKVRAGTYRFQVGEDFDSIISKISPKASGS